jgi:hypothetical protein
MRPYAVEEQVRRLETQLAAALLDKEDLVERFDALMTVSQVSATRLTHLPSGTEISNFRY